MSSSSAPGKKDSIFRRRGAAIENAPFKEKMLPPPVPVPATRTMIKYDERVKELPAELKFKEAEFYPTDADLRYLVEEYRNCDGPHTLELDVAFQPAKFGFRAVVLTSNRDTLTGVFGSHAVQEEDFLTVRLTSSALAPGISITVNRNHGMTADDGATPEPDVVFRVNASAITSYGDPEQSIHVRMPGDPLPDNSRVPRATLRSYMAKDSTMFVVEIDVKTSAYVRFAAHELPVWSGLDPDEIHQARQIDITTLGQTNDTDSAIVGIAQAQRLQIFFELPRRGDLGRQFLTGWKDCMRLVKLYSEFWYYRFCMDKHIKEDADKEAFFIRGSTQAFTQLMKTDQEPLPAPRFMATQWRVGRLDGRPVTAVPTRYRPVTTDITGSPAFLQVFIFKLGIFREFDAARSALKDVFTSQPSYFCVMRPIGEGIYQFSLSLQDFSRGDRPKTQPPFGSEVDLVIEHYDKDYEFKLHVRDDPWNPYDVSLVGTCKAPSTTQPLPAGHYMTNGIAITDTSYVSRMQMHALDRIVTGSARSSGVDLESLLFGTPGTIPSDKRFATRERFEASQSEIVNVFKDLKLDDDQINSVIRCVNSSQGVTLLQGAPGTGKTTTLVGVIWTFLRMGMKPLVTSHSNQAAQNIARRFGDSVAKIGGNIKYLVLRSSQQEAMAYTVGESMVGESQVDDDVVARHSWPIVLDNGINSLANNLLDTHDSINAINYVRLCARLKVGKLREGDVRETKAEAKELFDKLKVKILSEQDVVFCTNIAPASKKLEGFKADALVIDESSMTSMPGLAPPLAFGKDSITNVVIAAVSYTHLTLPTIYSV